MVFLTSNLGAAKMSSLVSPRLGFQVLSFEDAGRNAKLRARLSRTGAADTTAKIAAAGSRIVRGPNKTT